MPKFVPRERKHKRIAREKQSAPATAQPTEDANAETILPGSREQRRSALNAELRVPEEKISAKKRKRLDKYIDTKLKKEENLELLKKLAKHKVDTSLLQSSRKLGRVHETKRERLSRALNEKNAGIDVDGQNDTVLYQTRREAKGQPEIEEDDESDDEAEEPIAAAAPEAAQAPKTTAELGSGLKRPLETDESGQPVIKSRKRRKPTKKASPSPEPENWDDSEEDEDDMDAEEGDPDEWTGFDSEDGAPEDSKEEVDEDSEEEEEGSEDEDDDEDSEDEDEDESESEQSEPSDRTERVSAFKAWATSQRNTALEFTPSTAPTNDEVIKSAFKPREHSPDPVIASIPLTKSEFSRPAAALTIPRVEAIQAARMELPVVQEEQRIMEAIHNNPVVVICGATGSGKTTQVPQMMFESGYGSEIGNKNAPESKDKQTKGLIGVTQPRRVAAVSVAERVAVELGPEYRNRVAHQVRYDSNVGKDTAMKFMTDGILLREISNDFILSKYSAVVIDEAHERSVNTDILIGMLSRIVNLRAELAKEEPDTHYPLKLVIMSATLRVSDFAQNQRLFRSEAPPIVEAEGRQFTVTDHFSKRTQRDYVSEMVRKVARGHRKLPAGGMLVFLTAQNEIQTVAKQLKEKLGSNTAGISQAQKGRSGTDQMPLELDDFEDESTLDKKEYLEGEDSDEDSEPEITGLDDDEEDREFQVDDDDEHPRSATGGALKPHILPLYAALPSAQQLRVFQSPPEGSRLIVLATNVAETSLTIPGIRYVFDCGRSKEKRYDINTGVQTFEVDWISKASASQRAGRAGRTGPGHCYRLFSSAVYEQFFAQHTIPEILRTPLESTVLQLKSMAIENVVNFPFPTAPDANQLAQADRLLRNLGAIGDKDGRITDTGREIMSFPVSPRYGKMLLLAQRNAVLAPTIALVAGLAVGDLFIPEVQSGELAAASEDAPSDDDDSARADRIRTREENLAQTAAQQRHQTYTRAHALLARWDDQSDAIKLLTAVAAHAEASSQNKTMGTAAAFCADFFIREKGMLEVQQLRHQLHSLVAARNPTSTTTPRTYTPALPLPSEKERKMLTQIVAAGFIDQVAVRADLLPDTHVAFGRKPRRAGEVAYRTLQPSAANNGIPDKTLSPQDQEMSRSVFVHPSSVLSRLSVAEMPSYIVYSHLSRAAPSTMGEGAKVPRTRLHPLTTVGPKQLAALAEGTPLLEMGKPLGKIEEVTGGKRMCWLSVGVRLPGTGAQAWPLGAWKVVQVRKGGKWETEKVVAR